MKIRRVGGSEDQQGLALKRQERDSFDHLKMAAVIGAEGDAVAEGCAGDEQVAIANGAPQFPEAATLLSKQTADCFIEREHDDTGHKLLE